MLNSGQNYDDQECPALRGFTVYDLHATGQIIKVCIL